jgi:hypothetical protein
MKRAIQEFRIVTISTSFDQHFLGHLSILIVEIENISIINIEKIVIGENLVFSDVDEISIIIILVQESRIDEFHSVKRWFFEVG